MRYDGSKKTEFCSQHAMPGTVPAKSKMCADQGCIITPSFGSGDGRKVDTSCSQHATAELVDVIGKRCTHRGCSEQPRYGMDNGSKKA